MTTSTLTPTNEANGKTYYEPIIRLCKGGSKYNGKKAAEQHQFYFEDLEDFWTIGKNTAPVPGQWYSLEVSTKPSENGMWRDIVSIEPAAPAEPHEDSDWEDLGDPRAMESERPNAGPPDWDAIQATKDQIIQLGASTRDAVILIQMGVWPIPEGRTPTSWIRECRARLFYNVHAHDIEPQYWCYDHNCARNKGSNGYGHPVAGGSCIWEKGILKNEGE